LFGLYYVFPTFYLLVVKPSEHQWRKAEKDLRYPSWITEKLLMVGQVAAFGISVALAWTLGSASFPIISGVTAAFALLIPNIDVNIATSVGKLWAMMMSPAIGLVVYNMSKRLISPLLDPKYDYVTVTNADGESKSEKRFDLDQMQTAVITMVTASGLGLVMFLHNLLMAYFGIEGISEITIEDVGISIGFGTVIFMAWAAYGYPMTLRVLRGVFQKLPELSRKLRDEAYANQDSEEKPSQGQMRKGLAQILNFSVATSLSTITLGLLHGSTILAVGVGAVVFLLSYGLVGKLLSKDDDNMSTSNITSVYAAVCAYSALAPSGPFAIAGALVVAALAVVANYFLVFPGAYVLLNRTLQKPIALLTSPLVKLNEVFIKGFDKVFEKLNKLATQTYSSEQDNAYRDFIHQLLVHATPLVIGLPAIYGAAVSGNITQAVINTLLMGLGYLLGGRLLIASGNYLLGTLTALAAGFSTGQYALSSHQHPVLAVGLGLLMLYLGFSYLYPVIFVLLKGFCKLFDRNSVIVGNAASILKAKFDKDWARFQPIWDIFIFVFDLAANVFKAVGRIVNQAWKTASAFVKAILDAIFGRK
jgi:hypothetical protein